VNLPGGYEAVRLLGEGSSGTSWLARRPARLRVDGDHVVVKVLRQPLTDGQFEHLSAELSAFAAVESTHLVPLYEVGIDAGRAHVVMAYGAGGSLECPRRPLVRAESVRAAAAVAHGLAALHEAELVHGNVKPANVLLHDRGAWLSDPASAVLAPFPEPVEYVDPDVLRGAGRSRTSDVWSLGVTMHRALTGSSLYGEVPEVDRNAAVHHVLSTAPRLGGGLHPGEALVIGGCLAAAAGERPTATGVADRIEPLVEGAG
jgi:serine/threonine protein kinase